MADITMCIPRNCPVKDKCYRYTAPENKYWQAYSEYDAENKDEGCSMYWDNEQRRSWGAL